ncbi:iron chelate uptake ABC transporter family permease subunit [Paenibacillus amylolyticus]|uniref:iron chelate uptake ABC transporter family permease subunit n=1 Tax=Paenibacillus amylolyticus TaxID=1451 RepID=UPI003EB8E564
MIGLFVTFAILSVIISLAFGAISVDVRSILSTSLGNTDSDYYTIIWNIRLPRTLVAVFVGVNLALSGALLQGVMRNPMADPHIIGVSSGAGLFGTTMLLVFPAYSHFSRSGFLYGRKSVRQKLGTCGDDYSLQHYWINIGFAKRPSV